MKQPLKSLSVMLVLGLAGAALAQDDDYESLFNGRDLTGWDGNPAVWSVEDGAIVGRTTADAPIEANTFLIWQGGEVDNFQLELEFRLEGGNSGVQYRSHVVDAETWSVGGYQADMEAGPNFTGILYEEQGRGILTLRGQSVVINEDGQREATKFAESSDLQKVIRPGQWNKYVITARRNSLSHTINGLLMSKTVDNQTDARRSSGILALQVHRGPPMTVRYRNLRLKRLELPPEQSADEEETAPPGPTATLASAITTLDGFRVELLYSVPPDEQSSWVAMTADPQGRLIVSSEAGRLYRVTPPPLGEDAKPTVEPIAVRIGSAQGLLWAHDSLYVVVNGNAPRRRPHGLYRVRDTDGDDRLDDVQLLRAIRGAGEHGPHAVVLGPNGDDLYVVAGNHTPLPEVEASLVPRVWDEDQLLPPMPDGGGHAVGIRAPGGWICRTDPEGQAWEVVSTGYRNAYDIAFNADGELFTYDADMEWDIGAPWYRPTRICHATSGSEFGWRSGSGKWPPYYPDSLPAVLDMGPGSPTGVTFGYGAKFPIKYQQAFYVCDWSFGMIEAVHLEPSGGSYQATSETFLAGAPLPLTDVVVNPRDGAMYFTIGGRGTQSGLYRVTYEGDDATDGPDNAEAARPTTLATRRQLERWHGQTNPAAIDFAWPYLRHADRFVRYAARTAIEWQPVDQWQQRALDEQHATGRIEAAIALARHADPADSQLPRQIVDRLAELDWDTLSKPQRLALLRAYGLIMIRLPGVDDETRAAVTAHVDRHFPAADADLDRELATLLVYLDAPGVVERSLALQSAAATQEEQVHYAIALRDAIAAAPPELQRKYFEWFQTGRRLRGGYSLRRYIDNIKEVAVDGLSDQQRAELADVLNARGDSADQVSEQTTRPLVAEYTVDQVTAVADGGFDGCDLRSGRELFSAAQCFQCHRIGNEGGATGPDLTTLGRRFSIHDTVEAIVDPDRFISDRYRQTTFILNDGRVITGRVANHFGEQLMVVTDMLNPGRYTSIKNDDVESAEPAKVSQMPTGLLNTFTEEEIRDLLAYLLSGNDTTGP